MVQVQKKPDELHFSNDGLIPAEDNVDIESEYGEIVRKPAPAKKRRKKRPHQVKPNLPQLNSTNRNRVTNMMRKYLVRMHKKKGRKVNKDRTFNAVPFNKKTEYNVAYQLPDTQGKFLSHPLEHLKNKTKLFANKFLSLFTIIQFANSKCQASNSLTEYEGTCYLATECEQMNGIAMGNCADGHGVCCVFKGSCGGVGSNNCTYFESPGYPNYFPENGGVVVPPETTTTNPNTPDPRLTFLVRQGRADDDLANALSCIYKVYKSSDNIKQMRIDFIDLELKGPTNGVCVDEKLVISGSGLNTMVPILCGYNTGQHIYVDVESLSGPLQIAVLANNIERKRYKMKICQYDDSCSGLMSCLQYYTGISGVISSFNYEKAATFSRSDPQYLNNLNYAICIKREPGYCTVTYRTTGNNVQYPFELKNFDEDGMPTVPNGQAGVGVINCPDDYIVVNGIRLCGDRLNDGSVEEDFSLNAPVTDMSNGPIVIPVKTSGSGTGRGFKLFYMQNKCGNGNGMGGGNVPDPRT
ncbi:PREDICTED: uncharacterized protein LOC108558006 [Nicrophorus vespilloides]|uniref:Uncharacterized protein LOC108558006 n=1 Tax=Nicrophorus vespilloides TaxID=110193 RepID=A0ABM1M6S7_NICVS|nr:PREDICTED: uncharacterized protein LOC108558006 [Nicrophorus vespilloides]